MAGIEAREEPVASLSDNRMRFIRLLDDTGAREYCVDYEFASEARIAGQLNYAGDNLILRLLTTESDRDGLLKYTLSLSAPAEYKLPQFPGTKDGYHFDGDGAKEILSLTSLYLRCRFFLIAQTSRAIGGPPLIKTEYGFSYINPRKSADSALFDEAGRNFVALNDFFDQVRILPEPLHHRFANSVRLYALALREIGTDDQLAYLHLVSAIEILSKYQTLSDEEDPLASCMAQIQSVLDGASVEANGDLSSLFENRKTMLKFCCFIQEHSPAAIPEKPTEGALENKVYQDNLFDTLKKVYRARSKFLHEGASMYLSYQGATANSCDFDASVGQTVDNREFNPADKLPNIIFFENLVRTCLLDYLAKCTMA